MKLILADGATTTTHGASRLTRDVDVVHAPFDGWAEHHWLGDPYHEDDRMNIRTPSSQERLPGSPRDWMVHNRSNFALPRVNLGSAMLHGGSLHQ